MNIYIKAPDDIQNIIECFVFGARVIPKPTNTDVLIHALLFRKVKDHINRRIRQQHKKTFFYIISLLLEHNTNIAFQHIREVHTIEPVSYKLTGYRTRITNNPGPLTRWGKKVFVLSSIKYSKYKAFCTWVELTFSNTFHATRAHLLMEYNFSTTFCLMEYILQ